MQIKPRDPLLAFAHLWLRLSMGLALVFTGAFAMAFPALLILHDVVLRELAEHKVSADLYPVILTVVGLLGLASILSFYFLRHLTRIVSTVGEGDPFVPVNAERLRAMGWLTIAVDVVFAVLATVVNLAPRSHGHADGDFTFTLGGILLALVLFVLARVFREGTRLRDELEGTV
jgi:hypothetical protein